MLSKNLRGHRARGLSEWLPLRPVPCPHRVLALSSLTEPRRRAQVSVLDFDTGSWPAAVADELPTAQLICFSFSPDG